jgi:hypothetical protein
MRQDKPAYQTVGKSRKKIVRIIYEPRQQSDRRDQWQRVRQQVMESANIEIEPSVTSRWCWYSRLVNLCAPIEVRNEADLSQLAVLAKRLLKRELTLSDAFPGYRYSRVDWEREGLHIADADLRAHKVSP